MISKGEGNPGGLQGRAPVDLCGDAGTGRPRGCRLAGNLPGTCHALALISLELNLEPVLAEIELGGFRLAAVCVGGFNPLSAAVAICALVPYELYS